MPTFQFFADIDRVDSQSAPDAFGPVGGVSDTQFQVTSIHRAVASAPPTAYAVCDGILLAQDAGSNLVNLVLKPTQQPPFAFPKIKFFIYRGIRKSSLVSGSEVASETNNDLTKSIWQSQHARNTSAGTTDNPPAEALGLDVSGTGSIDQVYYREGVSYQLPLVRSGWSLGEFDPSGFGFEIMVEAIGFDPELPIIKTASNVINVAALPTSPTQAQDFEYWHDKEAILNYIDPSAFFGSFYLHQLKIRFAGGSISTKKNDAIYDDVLTGAHLSTPGQGVFFNRNRTYLDVRNEYNHSLNYFKNYGTYSNTDVRCAFDSAASLITRNYYGNTWPLMVLENIDLPPGNTSSSKNILRLALPDGAGDNPLPTLYVLAGYLADQYPAEPKAGTTLIDLSPTSGFTNEVIFALPNRAGLSSTTVVSCYIRLMYFKRFDPAAASPPVSSGTVVRAEHPLDKIFAPFAMKIPFTGATAALLSVVCDDELFLDADTLTGVYFTAKYDDSSNYSFVCLPKLLREISPSQRIALHAVNSNAYKTYLEHISAEVGGVEVRQSFLSLNQQHAAYLVAKDFTLPDDDVANQRLDKIVTLTMPKTALPASLESAFHPGTRIYLALKNRQGGTDDIGQRFDTFDLFATGYSVANGQIAVSEVDLGVTLYLKDTSDV